MEKQNIEIRVDAYTRVCLTAIAVLLTVLVVGLWSQEAPLVSSARADPAFGDMGGKIAAQLEAANKTNAKLDDLLKLLTSGQVKVQVVKDKEDGAPHGASNAQPSKPK